jgi:peptide-methionine (S)-S-oxide reductase
MRLSRFLGMSMLLLPVLAAVPLFTARSETSAVRIDPPALDAPTGANTEPSTGVGLETAVLAGGCFWGVQAVYQHTKGVVNAESGYAGGRGEDANYTSVSFGRTGHAESVRVTFDPRVTSYGKILQIFFSVAHDPTQLNRQGPDYGTQYRSEIFPQTDAQRRIAKAYIAQLDTAHAFAKPIVTKTDTDKAKFYAAEDYHQDYAVKHPAQPYIVINDRPKVDALKTLFPDVYRDTPMTVADAKAAGH